MPNPKRINPVARFPELWAGAKYIAWSRNHANPFVRIPRRTSGVESKSFAQHDGEGEYDLFKRCIAYRDRRGKEVWGADRWAQMLDMKTRIVARQSREQAGPRLGVRHYVRKGVGTWAVYWNERREDGDSIQESRHFSYGSPRCKYKTEAEARAAAIKVRCEKERDWYSTTLEKGIST